MSSSRNSWKKFACSRYFRPIIAESSYPHSISRNHRSARRANPFSTASFDLRRTITSAVSPLFIHLLKNPRPASATAQRQELSFADDRRIADFDPLGKFGSQFSMAGVDTQSGNCAQNSALRNG